MPNLNDNPHAGAGAGANDRLGRGNQDTPNLFDPHSKINPHFDGVTFDPARDGPRLSCQLDEVRDVMAGGAWLTLRQIALAAKCPEASASARLRDLRKARFGCHLVARKRVAGGLFAYRLEADGEGVTA